MSLTWIDDFVKRFREKTSMQGFNIDLKLPAYPSPLGVKPDHVEQEKNFFARVKPAAGMQPIKLMVMPKYDGWRVHVVFDSRGISVICPKSKMELTEYTSALRKYQNYFMPTLFGGTIIEAEAVAYVRHAPKETYVETPDETFITFDQTEVGYMNIRKAETFCKEWRRLYPDRECPVVLYLHCFSLLRFCHTQTTAAGKSMSFSGSQVTTKSGELEILRQFTSGCPMMQESECKAFFFDSDGGISGTNMLCYRVNFASHAEFTKFLLETAEERGKEGHVVFCDRRDVVSPDARFSKQGSCPDGTPRALRDRLALKVKAEFFLTCAAVMDFDSGKCCRLYCVQQDKMEQVFRFKHVPDALKAYRVGDICIVKIRCTYVHTNGQLVGVKAPWECNVGKTVAVLSEAQALVSSIEDCWGQVPHWGVCQRQTRRLRDVCSSLHDMAFVQQMPVNFGNLSGCKREGRARSCSPGDVEPPSSDDEPH